MAASTMAPTDTIFAAATPAAASVAALVRVSGGLCAEIAGALGVSWARQTLRATLPGGTPCMLLCSPSPASYTGEDTLEIVLPGNPWLLRTAAAWLNSHGCRAAQPGEFTRRALGHGRINPSQATATLALVNAQSEADHRAALAELSGHLARQTAALADRLRKVSARHEMLFDFSEEEHAHAEETRLLEDLTELTRLLQDLCGQPRHAAPRAEPVVALFGPPNAGKSSLFNALVGSARALVSPLPGTTRDAVRATIVLQSRPATLVDLSGVGEHDSDQGRFAETARDLALQADVLLVLAAPGQANEALAQYNLIAAGDADLSPRALFVDSMGDLQPPAQVTVPLPRFSVSAASGAGMDALRAELAARVLRASVGGVTSLLRDRIAEAAAVLNAALADDAMPGEARAREVRHALTLLDQGLLAEAPGDVLDYIFGQFCIGK